MMLGKPLRGAFLVAATLLAATAGLAQQNVALSQPFTCSSNILSGWTGLVDGVKDSDSGPGCFATSNDPDFPKYVVIDLQIPYMITRVAVYSSANGNTREVTIALSADGDNYEVLRDYIFPDGKAMTLNHNFAARPRTAQFVRIGLLNSWGRGLGGDNCIFLREVEVFGVPTGGRPVVVPPTMLPGAPLITSRSLRMFRKYCLEAERDCRIIVMGDSFAGKAEGLWPRRLLSKLDAERPAASQTELTVYSAEGLGPGDASTILLDDVVREAPDLVLLSFGADLTEWDQRQFRTELGKLTRELMEQTDGLVVLVAPPPVKEDPADPENKLLSVRRRAAWELEQMARFHGLPMLRTEAALRATKSPMEELVGADGNLLAAGHQVVADRLFELLMQP